MPKAEEFQVVAPNLCVWSAYSPEIKAELYSTAYINSGSIELIDPVELSEPAWNDLLKLGTPRSVLLTSGNHLRDADLYRKKCRIPVVGSVGTREDLGKEVDVVLFGTEVIHGLKPVPLPGGGPGETAFLSADGVLILGDVLISMGGELAVLPDKYCTDAKKLRESLRKLLDLEFNTVTFAHGLPLTQKAKERLAAVIG